jgi:actin-like ATPase involved in cell morphogenesis
MLDATKLKNEIHTAIGNDITIVETMSVDGNGKLTSTTKEVTNPDIDKLIEAIATAVIAHIKDNFEINTSMASGVLTHTTTQPGVGGGVPGPVTIPPIPLVMAGATLTIPIGGVV